MKKLKKNLYFVVTAFFLFMFTIEVNAQTSPLWGDLKPGSSAVGYLVMHQFDRSRVFMPERDYEGKVYTGERSRSLQIQLFYPARSSVRAAKMSYGDYLNVKANTPVAAIVAENLPFYNVNNVTVPVLERHQNAPTVSYEVTDSLRYAPRYSFDIKGLNHIDFKS